MKPITYTKVWEHTIHVGKRKELPWREETPDERSRFRGYKDAAHEKTSLEQLICKIRLDNYKAIVQMTNQTRLMQASGFPQERMMEILSEFDKIEHDVKSKPETHFWGHYRYLRAVQNELNAHDHLNASLH